MKRCDACRRVLPDDEMRLCPYDGTPLLDTVADPNAFAETIGKGANDESASDPIIEKAAQVAEKLAYRRRLESLLDSEEGLRLADSEMQSLFSYVKEKVGLIQQNHPELEVRFSENSKREGAVYDENYVVLMSWQPHFANTLSDSSLQIVERKRTPFYQESDELNRLSFDFYMNSQLQIGWKERTGSKFLTTPELGQECIGRLLHRISRAANKTERE